MRQQGFIDAFCRVLTFLLVVILLTLVANVWAKFRSKRLFTNTLEEDRSSFRMPNIVICGVTNKNQTEADTYIPALFG
jgi:hypothetical protein